MATTLGQRCTVYLDGGGVQRFKIASSVDSVLAGDLPIIGSSPYTSAIFVHKIVIGVDPKADVFLRVGNVADLTTLSRTRELALGLGQPLYLSNAFTVIYDDLATASQAKTLIQQRVDNLIADWHAYNEQFLAPVTIAPDYSTIPLPLTLSEEQERKDAYNAAHAELLLAKVETATAAGLVATTTVATSAANEAAADAVADSQQCSTLLGQLNSAITAEDAFRSTVTIFAPSATTFSTASLAFYNASIAYQTASATYSAAAAVYLGLGPSPGTGPFNTFTTATTNWANAVATWNVALTTWNAARAAFNAAGLNAAISAELINGQTVLAAVQTDMTNACTEKIGAVTAAASKKTAADKEAADALTAKKAADQAQSAALIADSEAYLSVKELCPDFTPTTP